MIINLLRVIIRSLMPNNQVLKCFNGSVIKPKGIFRIWIGDLLKMADRYL